MGRWWANCQKPMGNVNWDLFFEGLTVLLRCSQKSGVFHEWAQPETGFEWSHRVSNRLILFSVHSCPLAIKTLLKRKDFSPCQMALIMEGIFVCAVVPRVVHCVLRFGAGKSTSSCSCVNFIPRNWRRWQMQTICDAITPRLLRFSYVTTYYICIFFQWRIIVWLFH